MRGLRVPVIAAVAAGSICIFCVREFAAEFSTTQEAPTGYTTPTLSKSPGILSSSNGIPEPIGDSYSLDQSHFEETEGNDSGLGPVYNATSCVSCHQNPVSGGSSQVTELRAAHIDHNGDFTNPTISTNDGRDVISGRSLINDRAVCANAQEHLPETETIRSIRISSSVLGDGFVEAVPDETFIALSQLERDLSGGRISGEYVMVPVLEVPNTSRVGRFGWKDQHASLLSFSAVAYLDEIGITNRLEPTDVTNVCKATRDPEDNVDQIGMADIDHFAQFIRGTKAPPRDLTLSSSVQVVEGEAIFHKIGCEICHLTTLKTAPPGTVMNGGSYVVSEALGNKAFHPYSDFLLHDIETGDGIIQGGPKDTANKIRTAPLWRLRTRDRYLHDGHSLTLDDAIRAHGGESLEVTKHYSKLSSEDRSALLKFLSSL